MGRPAAPAAAAAPTAAALLALLALLAAASEQHPGAPNSTSVQEAAWKGGDNRQQLTVSREAPKQDTGPGGNGSSAAPDSSQAARAKEFPLKPPAASPEGRDLATAANGPTASSPRAGIPGRFFSGEGNPKGKQQVVLPPCLGCPQEPLVGDRRPMEARSSITRFAQPAPAQGGTRKLLERRGLSGGSLPPVPESQEDMGSGDQHARAPPSEGEGVEWTAVPTALEFATEMSSPAGQDLERDLLPGHAGEAVLPSPTWSGREAERVQKEEPLELWVDSSSSSPAEGAQGHTDLAWRNTDAPPLAATPSAGDPQTARPSSDPSVSEIIDIDYYDLFDRDSLGGAGPDSTKRKPSDDKEMSWSLHDLYDDFTPFDESDFYPTTSFYIDGDEEDLEEPEDDEEDEDGGGGLARDLEDENDYRIPTPATPKIQTVVQEAESTSRRYVIPPLETFVLSGGHGAATPKPRLAESGRDQSLSGGGGGGGGGDNGTECRSGYVRHNNSCKSVCDILPSYCHNGGQCYLVENLGPLCRCNTQDYIWHKGTRCESIITDFQVMCVAVGSAALVVLLLFMMTVFFAKKLYLLKTENNKLRKTKYRTPSELHNDNFSLSTIAEGSHPNDDPNAPLKLQDPLKSCLKEEESFNIQNSTPPKLDNGKGAPSDPEVNCLQNNLT